MNLTKETLKDYNISDASLSYNNLASDTLSLQRMPSGSPFNYGDTVTYEHGGRIIFRGQVSAVRRVISGSADIESVTIMSEVGWLDRVTYSETRKDPPYGYSINLGETTTSTGSLLPMDELLSIPFNYATTTLSLDAQTGLTCLDYLPSGQESVTTIMQSLSRYSPAVYAWTDHEANAWRWRTVEQLPLINNIDAQLSSYDIQPRYDLRPPSVCLTGGVQYFVGGSPQEPDAYVYHVNESVLSNSAYAGIQQSAQAANRQRSIIRGAVLPTGLYDYADNPGARDLDIPLASADGKRIQTFWSHFAAFKGLAGVENIVSVGKIYVDLVDADDLYPDNKDLPPEEQDPDLAVPYNYSLPTADGQEWITTAVLLDGSFPASEDRKQCLFGLRWCKATISMYAYVSSTPPAGTDFSALNRLFNSRGQVLIPETEESFAKWEERQLSLFTAEVILINRKKKSFYPIDLGLSESDPDYDEYEPEIEDYPEFPTEAQLKIWADQYYRDTRELLYDGSVSYVGYTGDPSAVMGTRLQVDGMPSASPVQSVSYDIFKETLTVKVGSQNVLSIDERIARYQATRSAELEALAANDNPQSRQAGQPLDQGDLDALQPSTISPQLSASVQAAPQLQRDVYPFTVYTRGDRTYFRGGSQQTQTGLVTIDDLDITDYVQPNQEWYISRRLNQSTRKFELVPTYRTLT